MRVLLWNAYLIAIYQSAVNKKKVKSSNLKHFFPREKKQKQNQCDKFDYG